MNRNISMAIALCFLFLLICSAGYAQTYFYLDYNYQTADTLYLTLQVYTSAQPLPGVSISNYYYYPWWGVAVDGGYPNWSATPGYYSYGYVFGTFSYFDIAWPITVEPGEHSFQAYLLLYTMPECYPVGTPLALNIGSHSPDLVSWELLVNTANLQGLNLRLKITNPTQNNWIMNWPTQPITCFSINDQMIMGQPIDEPYQIVVYPGNSLYLPITYPHPMQNGIYRVQAYLILPDGSGQVPVGQLLTVNLGNVQNQVCGPGDITANQPLDFYWTNSLYECIYTTEDLNGIHGQITNLAFYNQFPGVAISDVPVKIYLGGTSHTDQMEGWIPADQLSLVFDGNITFPAGVNEILLSLDTPFTLNQGENLVLMVQRDGNPAQNLSGAQFLCQTSDIFNGRLATSNTAPLDPLNPPASASFTGNTPKLGIWYIPGVENSDPALDMAPKFIAYPNPFHHTSNLDFTLKEAADLQIRVYNLKGQLVKTLFHGYKAAGIHSLSWDGRDEHGSPLSNGMYLYRITSAGFRSTIRTLLLK